MIFAVTLTVAYLTLHVVKNNFIPVIFPEGSRSKDGNLKTFHAAGFRRFLNAAPMPVAVCAVDGGWKISSLTTEFVNDEDRYNRTAKTSLDFKSPDRIVGEYFSKCNICLDS